MIIRSPTSESIPAEMQCIPDVSDPRVPDARMDAERDEHWEKKGCLYTIGTRGMNPDRFVETLKMNNVDVLVDIRLNINGPRYKQAAGENIQDLVEANGIAYSSCSWYAPEPQAAAQFRADRDWMLYQRHYEQLMWQRRMMMDWDWEYAAYEAPCLLCAEKSAQHCHRRLLGRRICRLKGLRLVHL